ncbi:MAG: 16S rRNA (guanine(966)-N(2))-methyltransferase RsmD [Gammaproteobacteria bacterium]|nr:MAG: 16S rRNA (guanine(966)-N(2))-methyltransferase RsmD [Gammaproteobacteria bacterium]
MVPPAPASTASGKLRIIGGSLRGSKLAVADLPGLRPTPDRVRETLFNWLAPTIDGARCLDLFAGTGALGIEALSRGASEVDFIECDPRLARALRDNLTRLRQSARVREGDALTVLDEAPARPYDLVFIDPPFDANLWERASVTLESRGWLATNALIYVECPLESVFALPATWRTHRESRAGAVRYALYRRSNKLAAS